MKKYLIFLMHLCYGTVGTLLSGVVLHALIMRARTILTAGAPREVNFELSYLAWSFLVVGLIAGYVTFSRVSGSSAVWIWLVPLSILIFRIVSFPAHSVFSSGPRDGWSYFFGSVTCSSPSLDALSSVAIRCLDRMLYLGMCLSAIAYSVGALMKRIGAFDFASTGKEAGL